MPERDDTAGAGRCGRRSRRPARVAWRSCSTSHRRVLVVAFAPPRLLFDVVGSALLLAAAAAAAAAARRACCWRADSAARRASSSAMRSPSLASASALASSKSLVDCSVASCWATRLSASSSACSRLRARRVAVVVEIGHEGVEFVARDIAGAQGDPGELVALEHVAQIARVLEQRPERGGAATDVRAQRHLAEAAPELVEFGFLDGDLRLGVDDLGIELRLGVDGFDVVLGELVRLLLEPIELVDDLCRPSRCCPSTVWADAIVGVIAGTRSVITRATGNTRRSCLIRTCASLANMTNVLRSADDYVE